MTTLYAGPANLVAKPRGLAERVMARLIRPGAPWNDTVARGGRLTVTAEDVVFRPHALNLCRDILQFPVGNVLTTSKEQHRSMRLLILTLRDESKVAFVSWQRDQVIAAIEEAKPSGGEEA